MINHKELRTENYIAYKGELHVIASVSSGLFEPSVVMVVKVPINHESPNFEFIETKDCEPILVDKSMLVKCNMNEVVINGFYVDKSEYGGMALWFISDVEAEDMGKVELCKIRGLHHLQNLFFDNTGHEVKLVK